MSKITFRLFFCFFSIFLLISVAHSRKLKNGDIIKIETNSGNLFQCKFKENVGDSIKFWSHSTGVANIAQTDICKIYRKKKMVGAGIIVGSLGGLAIGLTSYNSRNKGVYSYLSRSNSSEINKLITPIIIGSIAGGLIGSLIISMERVRLQVKPKCALTSDNNLSATIFFTILY
ncbi:MAG: hypothetical protein GY865_02905 [candidate division Zixibacteria bacterium]|nr:hypothetical protein [candidate division Zixibacteria bacterium]